MIERKYTNKEKVVAYLIDKGYPVSTNGEIPTYQETFDIIKSAIEYASKQEQEQQEVDLAENIKMEWDSFNKHVAEYGEESEDVVWLNWLSFVDIATYFYELGLKARKEE